jgi:hypothetical protein
LAKPFKNGITYWKHLVSPHWYKSGVQFISLNQYGTLEMK